MLQQRRLRVLLLLAGTLLAISPASSAQEASVAECTLSLRDGDGSATSTNSVQYPQKSEQLIIVDHSKELAVSIDGQIDGSKAPPGQPAFRRCLLG
jgi:hypothetical protein